MPPDPLPTCGIFSVLRFPSLPSTSSHARTLQEKRLLRPPCVILADRQTAGRGRHGRTWQSDAGAFTATFCLTLDSSAWTGLGARAAVLTCEALAAFVPAARIKWPNDVTIHRRKVAGVLVERLGEVVLIGIGINITTAPSALPDGSPVPTALADHVEGDVPPRAAVLAELCRAMEKWLVALPPMDVVRDAWDGFDALRGQEVLITSNSSEPLRGTADGIDQAGRLRLRGSETPVANGTVRLLEP